MCINIGIIFDSSPSLALFYVHCYIRRENLKSDGSSF